MPKRQPFEIALYHPKTKDGIRQLSRQVAAVHADAVIHKVNRANVSAWKKMEVIKAVAKAVKNQQQGSSLG